jgi:ubiquitin-conjugating enzyme E2 G1
VETILISVISLLADPNDQSPQNVDAAVSTQWLIISNVFPSKNMHIYLQKEWRENFPEFKKKVAKCIRRSQEECKL